MLRKLTAFKLASAVTLASMVSTQSLAAIAPASVDPLVTVSALGTPESRAAVCDNNVRTNGVAVVTQAAIHTGVGNCALPVTHASMATAAAQSQGDVVYRHGIPFVWVMAGAALVLIPLIAILASSGHGHGNLQPVSPQ
jgi:hypothetical protein